MYRPKFINARLNKIYFEVLNTHLKQAERASQKKI